MPWSTPSAATVRQNNANAIAGKLGLAVPPNGMAVLPNGEVRVLADVNAGNASLALEYLDWQADQYLPDTAEKQFLDRWATIFVRNADGSWGRKLATFAGGSCIVPATAPVTLPAGAILTAGPVAVQTTAAVTLGAGQNTVPVAALDPGAAGNLAPGTPLSLAVALPGVSASAGITVVAMSGGADEETDDELRPRVLARIRQPPMGGCAADYVAWALQVPAVTRAWCAPKEMGPGTVSVRFMMDDLRASASPATNGFPLPADLAVMQAYLDLMRPVCGDVFALAPLPQPINFAIRSLTGDSPALRAAIGAGTSAMLLAKAAPASQSGGLWIPPTTIPSAWVNDAIYQASGGAAFDLLMQDAVMPNSGALAVLGTMS